MDTDSSDWRFDCRSCGASFESDAVAGRCPNCGGLLRALHPDLTPPTGLFERMATSMWDFEALLPVDESDAVSMGEGGTPLVSAPNLAAEFGVDRLLIKDEGQNPTGSVTDRELALAVTALGNRAVDSGSLAAPGAAGQSFAAFAARAGMSGTVYLPSRAPFERKAMCNVHGIDLTVVRGRLPDAQTELRQARAANDLGQPVGAFETPYRYLGASTIAFELLAQLSTPPDVIVVPTGSGHTLVGIYEGLRLLQAGGVLQDLPRLVGVQSTGCAPIADAYRTGNPVEQVAVPDTVCGELEWSDPDGGSWVLEAIEATNGTMVAVSDDTILDMGVTVARESGLELRPDAAAGPAAIEKLGSMGQLDPTETVLAVSPGRGGADLLRSRLGANPR
ncbi:MAG: threonine synthase [Halodesulfurarchaeum sp.]